MQLGVGEVELLGFAAVQWTHIVDKKASATPVVANANVGIFAAIAQAAPLANKLRAIDLVHVNS